MYVKYGNYQHVDNEAGISMSASSQFSDRGVLKSSKAVCKITGVIIGSSQDDLRTKASALMQAYQIQNQLLGLYHDDGSLSHIYLDPAEALGGVKVTQPPSFTNARGRAEYATGRSYEITVEADYPALFNGLLSFQESLSFQGNGGPRHVFFELMQGSPVRQQVAAKTLYRATQSGSAVGQLAYPTVPAPLWPNYLLNPDAGITYTGGTFTGSTFTGFGVSWNYQFVSDVPFFGLPTLN